MYRGRQVGGVEEVGGEPDDRRIRWNWWLEQGYLDEVA